MMNSNHHPDGSSKRDQGEDKRTDARAGASGRTQPVGDAAPAAAAAPQIVAAGAPPLITAKTAHELG